MARHVARRSGLSDARLASVPPATDQSPAATRAELAALHRQLSREIPKKAERNLVRSHRFANHPLPAKEGSRTCKRPNSRGPWDIYERSP